MSSTKNLKRLRSKADKIWFIKHLKDKCEICDKPAKQVHHFYYKKNYPHIRYDKDNGVSLCMGCHCFLHMQDPKKIEEQIIKVRGVRWHNRLKKKAYNPPKNFKFNIKWLEEICSKK